MCDIGGLLGKIVGSSEISAKEPDLAVYIPLQQRGPVLPRELAMDRNGRGAGNGGHLPGPLAARLEAPNRAMKDDEVGDTRGVAVAVAIHMRESILLELANQVFVKGNLEFGRQLDFVRFNHLNLERRRLDLCGFVFLSEQWRGSENHSEEEQPDPRVKDALHHFCSLLGVELDTEEAAPGSLSEVVWAPWARSSFLITSDVPTGIVKMAPCRPPSASRY